MLSRPHAFKAVYTVTLHDEQLRTDFRVINTGDKAFEFTAALHTYIEVLDIEVRLARSLSASSFAFFLTRHCTQA
jgi:glucose-6-phosphate 1-epimerase